jgi:hypothetical protein
MSYTLQTITEQNAVRRLNAAADRGLNEYPMLAAPDGKITVDIDDLVAALALIGRSALRDG